jgi:hypothetical protein
MLVRMKDWESVSGQFSGEDKAELNAAVVKRESKAAEVAGG